MNHPKLALTLFALLPLGACTSSQAFLQDSSRPPALSMGSLQEEGQSSDLSDLNQEQEETVQVEWFKAGYYLGVRSGKSEVDTNSGELNDDLISRGYTSLTDLENDDSTFGLYGGYRFTEPFSVELGWVNLGQVESDISATPTNLNVFLDDVADVHPFLGKGVSLRGIYHIYDNERFQFGLSLGLWYWKADVDAEAAAGQVATIDESGLDLNYGLQGLLPLGNGFSVLLAWERYLLDDNEADTIWLGVQGVL